MKAASSIWALLFCGAMPALAADLSIAAPRVAIPQGATIGSQAKGALCVPAGRIRAADATMSETESIDELAKLFRRQGYQIAEPDSAIDGITPPQTPFRIAPVITAADLTLCRRAYMTKWLGAKGQWSGRGRMSLRWRLYDLRTRTVRLEFVVDGEFEVPNGVLTIGEVISAGAAANGALFLLTHGKVLKAALDAE